VTALKKLEESVQQLPRHLAEAAHQAGGAARDDSRRQGPHSAQAR